MIYLIGKTYDGQLHHGFNHSGLEVFERDGDYIRLDQLCKTRVYKIVIVMFFHPINSNPTALIYHDDVLVQPSLQPDYVLKIAKRNIPELERELNWVKEWMYPTIPTLLAMIRGDFKQR